MKGAYVKLNTRFDSLEGIKNRMKYYSVNDIIIREMLESPERVYQIVRDIGPKICVLDAFKHLPANNILKAVLEVVDKSGNLKEVEEL